MESLSQPMSTDPCGHRKELLERLDILRRNENFCDVTITVKGKEFKAHRAVLAAASPFFLTLLTSDMRESNEQLIRIDLEEATESVMEDVLKYVYTGNILVVEERAHDLFATANYLLLPSLTTVVGDFLQGAVSVENCVFNYYFADKYQCVELKEKCCDMIKSNFNVVMEMDDFLNLDVKQVMEWVSSDDVTVSAEEEVFKGIVKWVSHNKSEREGVFPELLHQVRLTSVSHDFLLNELIKEELISKNPEFCLKFVLNAMKLNMLSATGGQVNQQPRKCLETHTDGIFVCGERKALCYFPQQNLWYRLADTLFGHRKNHSLGQYKSKLYIFHGQEVGKLQVMEYFEANNTWVAIQGGTVKTAFSSHVVLKDDLYGISYPDRRQLYKYNVETNFWDEMEASPFFQSEACIVSDEQFVYIIGGQDEDLSAVATTTRFDPSNNKWEEVAPLNERRSDAFGIAMNDKVFVAGGTKSGNFARSCEVYNPTTDEWQLMPSLKVPRWGGSMVCFQGRLYVLGGSTYTGRYIRALTVEVFDSERNEWAEISTIPVKSFETPKELERKLIQCEFQACFARIYKGVINKLFPLN